MTEPLKNCPFCNGRPNAQKFIAEGSVQCKDCNAVIVRRHNTKKDEGMDMAIKAWQTRPAPDVNREFKAALKEMIDWYYSSDTKTPNMEMVEKVLANLERTGTVPDVNRELVQALEDIANGMIPNMPPLNDVLEFRSQMWYWSQKRAKEALASLERTGR